MKTQSVHFKDCPCGIPSPGSRRQGYQGGEHLRPATFDSVLKTDDLAKVTCKRCRKAIAKMKRK